MRVRHPRRLGPPLCKLRVVTLRKPASQVIVSEKPADMDRNLYHWRLRFIRTAHLRWKQKQAEKKEK